MDSILFLVLAIVAAIGFAAILVGIFHPAPSRTRFIRALCWPGVKPTDEIVLPLGGVFFFAGVAVAAAPWLPVIARIALVLAATVSAIILLRRRSAA